MMPILQSIRPTRVRLSRRESIYVAVWLAVAAATELAARGTTTSDSQDALGIVVWASLIAVTALDHARRPLRSVAAVVRFAGRVAEKLPFRSVDVALDLRGSPPIEQGMPRVNEAALLGSLVALVGLATVRSHLPVGLRGFLLSLSPTLWFAVLGSLWATALVSITVLLQQPWISFVREFSSASRLARQLSFLLFLGGLLWFSALIPTWIPLSLALGCLGFILFASASRKNPGLTLVFQETGPNQRPTALDWTQLIAIRGLILALGSGCLLLLMIGNDWSVAPFATSMPFTDFLGRVFALSLCLHSMTMTREVLADLATARLADAGGPDVPRLLVLGVPEEEQSARKQQIQAAGFDSVFRDSESSRTDVRTRWEPDPDGPQEEFALDSKWLGDEGYRRVLAARHLVLCRNHLRRGLTRIFRAAADSTDDGGSGYWLAPHLWYFEGLKRDRDEMDGAVRGPLFREAIPIAARRHFRSVLAALELDLIFFEDGVGYPLFERVLRRLFDVYDSNEGGQRAEEFHFAGVPRLLVVIHEHGLGSPLRAGAFPKPDYRFLGRARILHIFRDRSGETADDTEPRLSDRVPDLLPSML